jgi:hypothetical protein
VRLVYTDDPRLKGVLGAWLDRTELRDAEERAKLREVDRALDTPGEGTASGDFRGLRGIPAIGRGVGGAIAGSDPLREVIRRDERRRLKFDGDAADTSS